MFEGSHPFSDHRRLFWDLTFGTFRGSGNYAGIKNRNEVVHSTRQLGNAARLDMPSQALVAILAPVYKHFAQLQKRLRGVVLRELESSVHTLARLVEDERQRHLQKFAGRTAWVD